MLDVGPGVRGGISAKTIFNRFRCDQTVYTLENQLYFDTNARVDFNIPTKLCYDKNIDRYTKAKWLKDI